MKIMSVNAGSSSLKFKLLEMPTEKIFALGLVERIGCDNAIFNISFNENKKIKKILPIVNHKQAIKLILDNLIEKKIINSLKEIEGIGHRIVQGGEIFKNSVILTEENINKIATLNDLAPLHNPINLLNIKLFKDILPEVLQIGVFDTTFHQTMEEENFLYATPYEWYQKYKIRKYGAHGTSYRYITSRVEKLCNKKELKLIVCHAGNGVSLAAIKNGNSIDTSMGFTPLEGVPMGTRSGNIDPAIIPFISIKENKNSQSVVDDLNKKSGYLGVSGVSNDARDLETKILQKHRRSILALNIQIKRIVDYIASFYVLLEGADYLIFTAGIGENSSFFRQEIVKRLKVLNIYLDSNLNEQKVDQKERIISSPDSQTKIMIIPTNEEIIIARDVFWFKTNNKIFK
ncbi:MAG: acetate kinase [Candidatus Phytoplasma cynodontis]|uniref:acetate kinase n=1 Tax='Cynodon dactylon' phytoplasma TaxID=295320 RepID=UPI001265CE69|nr:acetate kinase ['Cynodon dactylon' phytoplasma]KAB8121932.1 acetate kinase ['Cynodon dactylon' phytoplasma]WIA07659.1 MAG: acetate kinase [Candidatus Phytoplasma cynodontis]